MRGKKKLPTQNNLTNQGLNVDNFFKYVFTHCSDEHIDEICKIMPINEPFYVLNDHIERFNYKHSITPFTRALVLLRRWGYPGYMNRRDYPHGLINAFAPPIPDNPRVHPEYQLLSNSMFDYIMDAMSNAGIVIHSWFIETLRRTNCFENVPRHFHIRKDGKLAYTPAYKPTIMTDDNKWSIEGRQIMKIGKGIRYLFNATNVKPPYNESQMSIIGEQLMGIFNFNGKIGLFNGGKQVDYYHGSRYAERNTGTLANSCMRYDTCSDYVQILADAPNVEMVVAFDQNDAVIGRANVYHNTVFSRGNVDQNITFVDRIYGKPVTINAIINFCHEQGWVTKTHQNYHDTSEVSFPNGSVQSGTLRCKIPTNGHETIVYMDTFKHGYIENDVLVLSNSDGDLELTGTEGNHFNEDRVYIRHLDGYYPEDDACWSEYESEYIHCDDAVYSNAISSYIFMDESTYLEWDDDYLPDGHHDIVEVYTAQGTHIYALDSNVNFEGYVPSVGRCNIYDDGSLIYDDFVGAFVYQDNIDTLAVSDENGNIFDVHTVLSITELLDKYTIDEVLSKCSF